MSLLAGDTLSASSSPDPDSLCSTPGLRDIGDPREGCLELPGLPQQPGWGSAGPWPLPQWQPWVCYFLPVFVHFSPPPAQPPAWFSFKQPDKYFTLTMLCKLTLHRQGMGMIPG